MKRPERRRCSLIFGTHIGVFKAKRKEDRKSENEKNAEGIRNR